MNKPAYTQTTRTINIDMNISINEHIDHTCDLPKRIHAYPHMRKSK